MKKRLLLIIILAIAIASALSLHLTCYKKSSAIYNGKKITLYETPEDAYNNVLQINRRYPIIDYTFYLSEINISGDVYISGKPLPAMGLTLFSGREKCNVTLKDDKYYITCSIYSKDILTFSLPLDNGKEYYFSVRSIG